MTRDEAQRLVNKLCQEHRTSPIKVVVNHRISATSGRAKYGKRELHIADWHMSDSGTMQTLKHEMAHFLAWDNSQHNGHGPIWQKWCGVLGIEAKRCGEVSEEQASSMVRIHGAAYIYECRYGCRWLAKKETGWDRNNQCKLHKAALKLLVVREVAE